MHLHLTRTVNLKAADYMHDMPDSSSHLSAYLGEKFGKNNCYISNWILGNEVNSASGYYYVGNVSFSKFISMYSEAFRCLYNAVKSSRGSSKVFICLDITHSDKRGGVRITGKHGCICT